jgi:isopropylmalate/homocitrate/citramalate synthase
MAPEIQDLNLSIFTYELMIKGKFKGTKTKEDMLKMAIEAVEVARVHSVCEIGINAEDAFRIDIKYLIRFASTAKEQGANRFRYLRYAGL